MMWSFRNKLKSLSDKEFLQYINNREGFKLKQLSLIDQEARSRFFSNRDFNGEDDEYLNPHSKYFEIIHRRQLIFNSSIVIVLLVLVGSIFFIIKPLKQQKSLFAFFKSDTELITSGEESPVSKAKTFPVQEDSVLNQDFILSDKVQTEQKTEIAETLKETFFTELEPTAKKPPKVDTILEHQNDVSASATPLNVLNQERKNEKAAGIP